MQGSSFAAMNIAVLQAVVTRVQLLALLQMFEEQGEEYVC